MVCSIFSRFWWFSIKFQIFAKSFWSGSPIEAVPPRTGKMAKSGSKQLQNHKKKLPRDAWRNSAHFDGKFDFFHFGWFSVKFQIFAKSFWSGSPIYALPPRTIKMAKSWSKRVQKQKKSCRGILVEIPHRLMVPLIFFTFRDFPVKFQIFAQSFWSGSPA